MKPFNLEEALAGKPVVTRGGRKVLKILNFETPSFPLAVAIEGNKDIALVNLEGRYWTRGDESDKDLFMASTKKSGWVNIYQDDVSYLEYGDAFYPRTGIVPKYEEYPITTLNFRGIAHTMHVSKKVADRLQDPGKERIAVVEITWEE